jgi:photosystem II stability/assembly factor-like uncharacterized protein
MTNKKIRNYFSFLIFILVATMTYSLLTRPQSSNHLEPEFEAKSSSVATEDNPYAALEFRYEMVTGGKTNSDPISSRNKAVDYTLNFMSSANRLNKATALTWVNLGPGNIGGRIRSIIINPSNSNEILIGSVSGGIWKTTNGGTSWTPKLDTQDPIAIGSMLLVGNSTVYAGTGEGWWNIDAVYGGGIYKSTDFGESWALLSNTVGSNIWSFRNVLRMTTDPSGNVYAVTKAYNIEGGVGGSYSNGGLFRSTDEGGNWNRISTTSITNYYWGTDIIAISNLILLYATDSGGIYRSTDSGSNWTKITSGLPANGYDRIAMAQDPNSPSIIYAVFSAINTNPPGRGLTGIYKSTNSGLNWSALPTPPTCPSTGNLSYLSAQGWYDNVIAVNPFNSNHIYVGGVEIMKSTNGGSNWTQVSYWHPYYGSPYVHADHHATVFDPNNSGTIYDGNDGGIFKTTDNGTNWTALNNGLEITQFYGGAVYSTGSTYYGGTQDNGHLKYSSGTSWTEVEGGDGGYAAQDQTNSSVTYEEYVYLDMEKSTNGGSTWTSCISGLSDATNGNLCLFISPFSLNPENSSVLIAGSNKVWITSNSAGSWTQSSNTLVSGQKVSAVTVVNSAANYLGFAGTTNGQIYKCTNLNPSSGIDTWTSITPPSNNGAWVRRIVVDLSDKNKIYACYSGYNNLSIGKHVWYSSDQGTSWNDISGNLPDVPVHSLVIDPTNSSSLYIGTETGVYNTNDRGITWSTNSSGMPTYVPVDELVLQTGTNKLFAFTHGRGVWNTTTPVPVELSSFTVVKIGKEIKLNWETKTEINNYGFDILRKSQDDKEWVKIGFVTGNGNSNSPKFYNFNDSKLPYVNTVKYKLKQIDNDGSFKFCDEVEVNLTTNEFAVEQNYPNPFNPITSINFSLPKKSKVILSIYNSLGELVEVLANSVYEAGRHTINWKAENLSSGIYFYTFQTNEKSISKKMLLIK